MDNSVPDPIYDLLLPFTITRSHGGPHDDDAFVSGWRLAQLDMRMTVRTRPAIDFALLADELDQADLIAMRHGYSGEVLGEFDEWVSMRYTHTM